MSTPSTKILLPIRPQPAADLLHSMFESALNLSPESVETFRAFVHDLEVALKLADIIDRFWTMEAAAAIFEVIRLQEIERRWIESNRDEAIAHLLVGRVVGVESLVQEARLNRPGAKERVTTLLADQNISESDIAAQAYRNSAEEIERLHRLRQRASTKLSQIVRDIEVRRLRIYANLQAFVEQSALQKDGGQ